MQKHKKLLYKEVKKIWNNNYQNMKLKKLIFKNKYNKLQI